jgi:hypothetical protein
VFSKTSRFSDDWSCIPSACVHLGYDDAKLQEIIDYQQKEKLKWLKKPTYKPKRCLLIFDDVIGTTFSKSNVVSGLFTDSRHINISIMVLIQYAKNVICPIIRNNLDYIFFGVNNKTTTEALFENTIFNGGIKEFMAFLAEHTKNYHFVLYDNTVCTGKWLKVKAHPVNFKLKY